MEDNSDFNAWLLDVQMGKSAEAAPFFEEEPDEFTKFVEQDELKAAGATGATGRAADPGRLRSERHVDEPPFFKRGSDDVDRLLQKAGGDRKKTMLKRWLAERLALGERVEDLVAHALRHDLATGNLLAEIGAELQAA